MTDALLVVEMSEKIKELFSRISVRYDLMNHLLSLGLDKGWRAEAAREAMMGNGTHKVLDLATGTGDLAIVISNEAKRTSKRVEIIATDFSPKMIGLAKAKTEENGIKSINFNIGDSLNTGYRDGSFDVVTAGFSLRNYDDLGAFVYEVHRILRPGGKFVFLDIAYPDEKLQRMFFRAYSKVILLAGTFGDKKAYEWLVSSMMQFDKKSLMEKVRARGFWNIRYEPLTSGIAFMVVGRK